MGNKNSSIKRNLANKNPYNYNKIDNIKQQHQVGATLNSKDLTVDQYEQLCNLTKLNKGFIKKMFTVFINDYPSGKIQKNEFKEFYSKFRPGPDSLLENICSFVFISFDSLIKNKLIIENLNIFICIYT